MEFDHIFVFIEMFLFNFKWNEKNNNDIEKKKKFQNASKKVNKIKNDHLIENNQNLWRNFFSCKNNTPYKIYEVMV
jgi:hypothetical protein